MRTTKFKNILWAVAYKTGQDPQQGDFNTNQAVPIGHSISQWVRREWPGQDFPEWTFVIPCTVNNHMVPYDFSGPNDIDTPVRIGKVFEVYLIDPSTTYAPVSTDFRLTTAGIHVGFDHGTNVWIKFTPPPPTFTAEVWTADRTYGRDEVAYLDRTGECYRSRFNGNKGHEPVPFVVGNEGFHGQGNDTLNAPPPASEIVQDAESGQRGSPVLPQVYDVYHVVALDSLETGSSFIEIFSSGGAELASVVHNHLPGDTQQSIISSLFASLSGDPDLATFTITLDVANLKIRLSDNSAYSVAGRAGWYRQTGIVTLDKTVQVSPFNPGIAASTPTPQKTEFTFTEDQIVAGATYGFSVVDPSGGSHGFQYTAVEDDSMGTVMDGLAAAMSAAVATDSYLSRISVDLDHTSLKFTVVGPPSSVDATIQLPGQPYWELVPFPEALADSVIRGAVADLNKEWGQTQEGIAEEQMVPIEAQAETATFGNSSSPLTNQQETKSRYSR